MDAHELARPVFIDPIDVFLFVSFFCIHEKLSNLLSMEVMYGCTLVFITHPHPTPHFHTHAALTHNISNVILRFITNIFF